MPQTRVYFYCEVDGSSPILEWLNDLRRRDRLAFAKCAAAIKRLAALGHELRIKRGRVHFRLLYFFHERSTAIIAHGLTKEAGVPPIEIERALARKHRYEANPKAHTAEGEAP